ncbi:GDSL-type esterase/lipase family protein [uncultured Croceitalea sp.]|uniref:GDSL-type esterase/lipase family protein n=1 Tax=uncultured Croceitalea sp. TaxID=1798908 RepID=UPI0033065C56
MRFSFFITLSFIFLFNLNAQNAFQKEVDEIVKRNDSIWDSTKETIVFTGSSSIRFWKDVQERFPKQHILNTGFGGSQASDLLYHLESLVLHYNPKKVFIYEGDNDIFSKKRPKEVVQTTQAIIQLIKKEKPNTSIILISAKPSIARWRLRGKYRRLNRRLEKLTLSDINLSYANVWDIMLNGRKVKKDIFVEDGLHMNAKGYELWYQKIKTHMK